MGGFPLDFSAVGQLGFDLLVLCAVERLAWLGDPSEAESAEAYGCATLHAPFHDDEVTPETTVQATRAAQVVADALHRGQKVLVTCNEGRNRSALVAALALLWARPSLDPRDVVDLIRFRRVAPNGRPALTNEAFVELIVSWPHRAY